MGQHRWSGWPGAYCMYCGTEDALEIAMADGWIDFDEDGKIIFDTKEHEEEVNMFQNNSPFVPDGIDPYSLPYPLERE